MNYKLANELKETGFPQGGTGTWLLPPNKLVARPVDRIYAPTLRELIEACGERDFTLMSEIAFGVYGWHAIVYDPLVQCGGPTPEEAVARLWLALNKKV